ncbi:universal stress protein [Rhodococcus triatomae]|uniref:Nucleotide-binding universal stress protein, UspA family n=1 Tax=Rhodococcus triatomae TaxID=300028 RepID=A0A1G8P8K9_9NOCA|nr:universal stress protein [Rhodococcus triatomae]QNG18723.1 universal stress protein [Rhodococcus triatomae]QNG25367.1 universal stress protein [Rhodococcus triatomae]SDI88676.1 Nucleotide-binding universal stress protein, UspA family [Rhodococcus triatomae]
MSVAVVHRDSPEGRAAIVIAAHEALQRRHQLTVLHVPDEIVGGVVDGAPEPDEDLTAVRSAIQAALDAGDVGETSWTLRAAEPSEDPVTALVDLVDDESPDFLVVGTRRKSAVGKFLLERWLQRVLLEVDVPVLVVKDPA